MAKFETTITTPEAYDGEAAQIIIKAVNTGRRWISRNVTDIGNAAEEAMIIAEMINDGEKLVAGDWYEMDRAGNVIYS